MFDKGNEESMRRDMKRYLLGTIICASMLLTACGGNKSQQTVATVQQPSTQEPTFESITAWRDGKDYMCYDVSDKNGTRKLWVEITKNMITIYNDDGKIFAQLKSEGMDDIEYSKKGFKFQDVDGDGYIDISMPCMKDEFGKYTYHWIYNFVDKVFMDKYAELTNEEAVLTQICNGVLGQNSSRQFKQVYNDADLGVVSGKIQLDGQDCKFYNVTEDGTVKARLCFGTDGTWYIDSKDIQLYSVLTAKDGEYVYQGVCESEKTKKIVSYTLGQFLSSPSAVASDISELLEAAGEKAPSASNIANSINSAVSAYEIVIDDKGTIRRMDRSTNVFNMVCANFGIDTDFSYLKK